MSASHHRPIALDAMGGDLAPGVVVEAALECVREDGLPIHLVGPQKRVRQELGRFRPLPSGLELVDAPQVVAMDDSPFAVLRDKRRSSLAVCCELVRDGEAAAMVSAGNTGAAWVAAKRILGMIPGVDRAALAAILPNRRGHTLLLDVGANMECKPRNMVEFAIMGSFYAEWVLGIEHPKVGLMSVGEEEGKGGRRVQEWYQPLAASGIDFVGNVEGRDVFSGDVDVIVCDGFTGNVILKVAESLGEMIFTALKEEAKRSPVYGAGFLLAKGAFRNLKRRVDYSEYGGAPLLGVNGACLIGHGRSSAKAIRSASRFASSYAESGILELIGDKTSEVRDRHDRELGQEVEQAP